jgi:Family of unknown function (DUF6051)
MTMKLPDFSWDSAHAEILSAYDSRTEISRARAAGSDLGFSALSTPDRQVAENKRINCRIVRPTAAGKEETLDRVCVLLHGLNERGWNKYEPWAQAIADRTGCAVILFPIAFHMDRSPAAWADFGAMRGVSKDRMARFPGISQSSMANAAISERLDESPDRLYLSGLMSALDLRDLIDFLRADKIAGIAPGARLGFFGYSIGVYLLQCVALADAPFARDSKKFFFCGGPYLSAMTPVSKYIMDSRAHEKLIDFWVRNLDSETASDQRLGELIETELGRGFRAMVDRKYPQQNRLVAFSPDNTRVASLAGDEVMPRSAIESFFSDTGVLPDFLDLPPACTHIAPFNPSAGDAARDAFDRVFDGVAAHLFG